jgi:hypothetical protein
MLSDSVQRVLNDVPDRKNATCKHLHSKTVDLIIYFSMGLAAYIIGYDAPGLIVDVCFQPVALYRTQKVFMV